MSDSPKFCVGDRVCDQHGGEYEVVAIDADVAWCRNGLGHATRRLNGLTLVPDTVLVGMPRDLRDAIADGTPDSFLGGMSTIIAVCRKSKEQDQ